MSRRDYNNQSGFALIVILVVMTIIAAIFFGSSYFSQKSQVDTYIQVNDKAEEMVGNIELDIDKRQEQIDKIEN